MMKDFFSFSSMEPRIVSETSSCLVLYKPPKMHTAPLRAGKGNTLLDWAACRFPEIQKIKGRKEIEGGLVHRLDYETQGLVLCARTEEAFQMLALEQQSGNIVKEYDAVCHSSSCQNQLGFPPLPAEYSLIQNGSVMENAFCIESAFRSFGKGRSEVRPVLQKDTRHKTSALYRTEILLHENDGTKLFLRIRIRKGFRHQIRCHLAWLGLPILNDSLYGNCDESGFLALRASSIKINPNLPLRQKYSLPV
jgi:23S rRNA pseudouridine1911/1915/1917 synthase